MIETRIPILRFRAGQVPCAVAARDVRSVRGASDGHAPLWRLLGVAQPAEGEDAAWSLGLGHGAASAEVTVQGPIDLAEVSAADLLQCPPTLVLANNDLIFGFVRCARELVVLFDIPTLVALAA